MSPNTIDREDYPASIAASGADIDAMVRGYLECQLWAGLDNMHPSCACHANDPENACHAYNYDENYDIDDISPEYVAAITEELTEVIAQHPLAVRMYLNVSAVYLPRPVWGAGDTEKRSEAFGHDFYLTREGHGAGFWDRGLGELGDYLTDIAKSYGSADMLLDNGDGVLVS